MIVVALVGSYRKGSVVDIAVDEVLAAARDAGAETDKIYLADRHIEFCTECRSCTQQPGEARGVCMLDDEMGEILDEIERADALVLGSPMNFGTVTAVTKRFIERLVCYAYWPWGAGTPRNRSRAKPRSAVLVASSAAPAVMARPSSRMVKLMKDAVDLLGAGTLGVLFVGLAAMKERPAIGKRIRRRARSLGARLAS